jgi:hypothetical protein
MQAHRIHAVVPEDHRLTIEFPAAIPPGPVELIVLVPEPAEQKLEEIQRGAEITKRLNDLFADGELAQEQARTASEWDEVGTDWSDESW